MYVWRFRLQQKLFQVQYRWNNLIKKHEPLSIANISLGLFAVPQFLFFLSAVVYHLIFIIDLYLTNISIGLIFSTTFLLNAAMIFLNFGMYVLEKRLEIRRSQTQQLAEQALLLYDQTNNDIYITSYNQYQDQLNAMPKPTHIRISKQIWLFLAIMLYCISAVSP